MSSISIPVKFRHSTPSIHEIRVIQRCFTNSWIFNLQFGTPPGFGMMDFSFCSFFWVYRAMPHMRHSSINSEEAAKWEIHHSESRRSAKLEIKNSRICEASLNDSNFMNTRSWVTKFYRDGDWAHLLRFWCPNFRFRTFVTILEQLFYI